MIARAVEKYVRMSPRKIRFVMEPLRQKTVAQALVILSAANRRAAKPVAKAIVSAYANARQQDPGLGEDQVVIERLFADGGPVWKRHRAAAFGRAVMILKRTSHITVELARLNGRAPASASTAVEAAPVETTPSGKPKKRAPSRGGARKSPSRKPSAPRAKRAAAGKKKA